MQKCVKCKQEFSWLRIYKSFLWTYKPIHCEACGTEHSITNGGRFVYVAMTIIPFFVFYIFLTPFDNTFLNLLIGFSILLFGSLLAPYFIKYSDSSQ